MRWTEVRRASRIGLAVLLPTALILAGVFLIAGKTPESPGEAMQAAGTAGSGAERILSLKQAEPAGVESTDAERVVMAAGGEHEAAAGPQPDDEPPAPPTPEPLQQAPEPSASPMAGPPRVGLQVGHWKDRELPDELARLRGGGGTSGGGAAEWELNLDIARRVAVLLEAEGFEVDVIPAAVPPRYKADAFVALHADGDTSGRLSGYKLARPRVSAIPEADEALLAAISDEYGEATGLPIDPHVSRNMTGYYAFSYRRFEHAVAPTTPSVILEMGFMTSRSDLRILLDTPDVVARGIANGILRFLGSHDG